MNKHYYLMLDIETANFLDDALAYDVGFAVVDRYGNIYERRSYCCSEIFNDKELMTSAYYAAKLPQYYADLASGKRKLAPLYAVRQDILALHATYHFKAIMAYNAYFDNTGLNRTQRYITKSKYRWFLPYGVPVHCVWHMACQVICSQRKYYRFCKEHNFISARGNISTSAETVYRFLTNNPNFEEEHQGLADVEIETAIFAACIAKKKKMSRRIYRACWRLPQRRAAD